MATLSESEVHSRLSALTDWELDQDGTPGIAREYQLEDFASALAFVNRVGEAAEAANHHPDILLHGWNKVRLRLSTHSEGGLTVADFELAERIDAPV